ncbi:MAG: iron-containing alcohol dehydrogenase [Spirochaetaceae bacterium]
MQQSKVTVPPTLPGSFIQAQAPRLVYGPGSLQAVPGILETVSPGGSVLLVTGNSAFASGGFGPRLMQLLREHHHEVVNVRVHGEPSPQVVDEAVREAQNSLGGGVAAVLALGGGSVIDAGKAAAAALCEEGSIKDFLEEVGSRTPSGRRVRLIAASTTAGTGSEGTKNAVLSEIGEGGYKKSLRHPNYVPDVAVLDPELHLGVPREVTAASGLDAITQLLEAYVSTDATPFTDAYCWIGLREAAWAFPRVLEEPSDLEARGAMALAAYLSGLSLASANLGLVHGAASPLGAARRIPHGVVCGTLVAEVTARSVSFLFGEQKGEGLSLAEGADGEMARYKYATAGRLLSGKMSLDDRDGARELVRWLREIELTSAMPSLGGYGFTPQQIDILAPACGDKKQPVSFDDTATAATLKARL